MKILIAIALVCVACKKSKAPAPPGPAVAWRATIDKDTYAAVAAANGTLISVGKSGVAALRDGKAAWTRALDAEPSAWLIPLGTDAVLAGDDKGTVHAIAIADGAVKWKATTPTDGSGAEPPWIKAAATNGQRIVMLDAYMRFLVVDPTACATGAASCMTQIGELASGATGEEIAIAPDGTIAVSEFKWVALFTASGERIASFSADDLLGGVATTASGIVVAHDQGVVRIDPARCKVEGGKFRLGTRADREDPPPGCVERIHTGPTQTFPPVASRSAVAWVTDSDEIAGRGAKPWQLPIMTVHSASAPVANGDTAYVACWVEPTGDDMFVTIADVCAIAIDTGALRWRSPLGLRRAGMLTSPWVEVGGGMIYVVVADQVAALPL